MGIENLMILIWFIVIIVTAVIEINTMDLTSVWFSIGGLFAFIFALIKFPPLIQIIAFLVVSIVLLLSVKPIAKNYLKANVVSTNADRLIGKIAICTKDIQAGERGEVKVEGQIWTAITAGDEFVSVGEKVEILAIEGVKLIVVKL